MHWSWRVRNTRAAILDCESRYTGTLGQYFWVTETEYLIQQLSLFGDTILDLGCGAGRLILTLAEPQRRLIALDISLPAVQIASRKAAGAQGDVYCLCGDALNLPLHSQTVTGIIAMGTFGHNLDLNTCLQEIRRVMTKDAHLFLSLWNKERWFNFRAFRLPTEAAEYSLDDVEQALQTHGFELLNYRSTFFMPRRLFWGIYRLLPWSALKDLFVMLSLGIEKFLMSIPALRPKGWEFLVLARVADGQE